MNDTEAIPLSALQHWCYCPRQCGLIHLEQVFDENVHTLRGQAVHAKVDQPGVETAKGLRVERALPLWHDELGLVGKADVVEFWPGGVPYPVEYKHGSRNKAADIAACDDIQLAAQAMCLAAMTGKAVNEGAIFYASSKRRRVAPITPQLRVAVEQTAQAIRQMFATAKLPPPLAAEQAAKRCKACSLLERCQPQAARTNFDAARAALFDPDA
ncbi:MAG: CRISPR-associated protein Cas4 [Polaromonas sp.]|nr:CRISPR-associated protein Cas4 [Polaromonas sp.]